MHYSPSIELIDIMIVPSDSHSDVPPVGAVVMFDADATKWLLINQKYKSHKGCIVVFSQNMPVYYPFYKISIFHQFGIAYLEIVSLRVLIVCYKLTRRRSHLLFI